MKGILQSNYADKRDTKAELIFRYKVRALVVTQAAKKHLGFSKNLNVLDMGAAEGKTIKEMAGNLGKGVFTGIEYAQELIDKFTPPRV